MFLIPTLLSAAGSLFGAAQRRRTAALNYDLQTQNAAAQYASTQASLKLQSTANQAALDRALFNADLMEKDAEIRAENAERLRAYAKARTESGREAMRRQRRSFDRFQSTQKATFAASGVANSGSVFDVLADTAGEIQIALQDQADRIQFERDENLNRASNEGMAAERQRLGAQYSRLDAQSAFNLNQAATSIGRINSISQYNSNLFGAEINRQQQNQVAFGQGMQAVGTIFAGVRQAMNRQHYGDHIGIQPRQGGYFGRL